MSNYTVAVFAGSPRLIDISRIEMIFSPTFRSSDDPTGTRTAREMAIAWAVEERKAIENSGV